jgi:hypothetical protein
VDLERFFNLVATVFGALGSIYVLKSIAFSSPELIAALSSTYIGFSSPQIDSLAKQKADNIVGIVLVVIALVITGFNLAFVPSAVPFVERRTCVVGLVFALAVVLYICLSFVSDVIRRREKLKVGRLIATERLNWLFENKRLPASEVGSLRAWAGISLEMPVDDSEPPRQLLERLAKELGLNVPTGFDFSDVEKPAR